MKTFPIPKYTGYKITTNGQVWSSWKRGRRPIILDQWRKLKPQVDKLGRHHYCLKVNQTRHTRYAHQLVLETFIGPRPKGMVTCHNNGNASDNRLENLRWDTQSANIYDSIKHGTYFRCKSIGILNSQAKLTEKQVRVIKWALHHSVSQTFLAKAFRISQQSISGIKIGTRWGHVLIK